MKPCLDFSVSLCGMLEEHFCEPFSLLFVAEWRLLSHELELLLLLMMMQEMSHRHH